MGFMGCCVFPELSASSVGNHCSALKDMGPAFGCGLQAEGWGWPWPAQRLMWAACLSQVSALFKDGTIGGNINVAVVGLILLEEEQVFSLRSQEHFIFPPEKTSTK